MEGSVPNLVYQVVLELRVNGKTTLLFACLPAFLWYDDVGNYREMYDNRLKSENT